jgi:hypothetical protein
MPLADLNDSELIHAAIACAAQLVVHPSFLETYQTAHLQRTREGVKSISSLMSAIGSAIGNRELMSSELDIRRNMQAVDEMLNVTPAVWAQAFQSITTKPNGLRLLNDAVMVAQRALPAYPSELRDTLPHKPDFPDECCAAYRRTREHLLASPRSPRWLALALFALGRVIGSSTRAGYHADQWNEGTFFWFDLERAWLQGDGARPAQLLVQGNKKFFRNKVADNLGSDMPRRLAESASIAPGWSLFHPPW